MKLTIKKISENFSDIKKLKALNNEAFPENERLEISEFINFSKNKDCDFLAFYEKQDFVGFAFVTSNDFTAYLAFFAVEKNMRAKGYGSRIINILKKIYDGKQLVADIECDWLENSNSERRTLRKNFYIRNGFSESGYTLSYNGMCFELMNCGDEFDIKSYEQLIKGIKTEIKFSIEKKAVTKRKPTDIEIDEPESKRIHKIKQQSWFPNTVATCSAVLLYIAVTHIDMVFKLLSNIMGFISPIVLGGIIAYLLNPVMMWYKSHFFKNIKKSKAQNGLSISLSVVTVILVLFLLLNTLIPQLMDSITNFIDNIGSYKSAITNWINGLESKTLQKELLKVLDSSQEFIDKAVSYITENSDKILDLSATIGSKIISWVIGFVLAVYFLAEKENILNGSSRILLLMLKEEKYRKTIPFLTKCNEILSRYISFSLIDALIIGIATLIFMLITGMSYSGLVALIIGITNLIPTFGPIIGGAIGGFILLIVNPSHVIGFVIFLCILQSVDGYVIKPKLFGDTFGVSGLLILLAIILGGRIFGVVGILLAIPIVAILDYVYKTFILKKTDD